LDTQANQGVIITDDLYGCRTREYSSVAPTMRNNSGQLKVNNIRRLTEIECERLQGFEDNHTEFGFYLSDKTEKYLQRKKKFTHSTLWFNTYLKCYEIGLNKTLKPVPKTQRYKLCGNAVTASIVEMIAKRIKLIYNENR